MKILEVKFSKKYYYIIVCLCLFILSNLTAQSTKFNIETVYPSFSTVLTLDNRGYVWFREDIGTDYLRYSGHGLTPAGLSKIINKKESKLVVDNPVFVEDKLLVQTENELSLLDLENQSINPLWTIPKNHKVDHYLTNNNGNLFVFTTNKKDNTRPVYFYKRGAPMVQIYDLTDFVGDKRIAWWSGISVKGDETYIHGRRGGLIIVDGLGKRMNLSLENPSEFNAKLSCSLFRLDNNKNIWRIYKDTISVYNPQEKRFNTHSASGKIFVNSSCKKTSNYSFEVNKILTDRKERIWFAGADSNLAMYDPELNESTLFTKQLVDNMGGRGGDIHDLIEDKHGNIYGSKRTGVFKISEKEQLFESYAVDTHNEDHTIYDSEGDPMFAQAVEFLKPSNIVKTVVVSIIEEGIDIYFMDYRFVYKVDKSTNSAKVMPFYLPGSKIRLMSHDDRKIVSAWSQVYALNENFQPNKQAFSPSRLEDIFQQRNGDTWCSGYLIMEGKKNRVKTLFAKLDSETLEYTGNYQDPSNKVNFDSLYISSMIEDENEVLWLGTVDGVYTLNPSDGIPRKQSFIFTEARKGFKLKNQNLHHLQMLASTQIGFLSIKEMGTINTINNEIINYVSVDDLGLNALRHMVFVNQNEVWYASDKGLGYYNFKTQKHIIFSDRAGLPKRMGVYKMKQLSNQKIALGTNNGLYLFNPTKLKNAYDHIEDTDLNTPLSLISYSYLNNNTDTSFTSAPKLDDKKRIEINYNDKMISFDFALMNFSYPENLLYAYKLEGYNKKWSFPSNENTIRFSSLPPGNYKLRVKASNGNGIWSNDVKSIPIRVRPAWYKTWWFILFSIIVLSTLAYILFRHYLFLEKSKLDKVAKQQEAKRLMELDDAKNIFFANISHEFRTPLTVIMGINENIAQHESEKVLIRRNSNHLLKLVNQLLDLSKLESNKMRLSLSQGEIVGFLKYLTASFYSMAEDKNIKLDFITDLDTLVMNYDEIRVQQICYNLLSNAIKFTEPKGHVVVNVSQVEYNTKDHLRLIVKDTGHGIPEKDLPRIFDHFYQVNSGMNKSGEGSGIGLALIKELLSLMDGEIEVDSKENEGTEFKVYLPIRVDSSVDQVRLNIEENNESLQLYLEQIEAQKSKESSLDLLSPDFDESKPVLLLIEDNADVTTYIVSILNDSYQIVICENGGLGIEKAIEIVPDIIISDVMMPVKDGFEVCQTLKQNEKTDHIPIILLTAKSTISDKVEGLKYGADAYLNKPFHKEELKVRLEQLLLLRKKMQERYSQQVILPLNDEPSKEDAFFIKLQTAVFDHISDSSFGVPELAQSVLMSQTQLFRKTKAILNRTPAIFIRSIRLEKSKELLADKDLSISEVANKMGFRDPSYFARAFQKEFGTSPSDFRK